jgi:hypothetical protein
MIGNNFYLKVIDFGEAKYLNEDEESKQDEMQEIIEEDNVFDIASNI